MLKAILKKLKENNRKQLERQFINEDLDKEILYYGKYLSEGDIALRQDILDKRLKNRENLYIYPGKVNV